MHEHDDLECREILAEIWTYLDGEQTRHSRAVIAQHLEDCAPCLRKYGIEQDVKALVARCCGHEDTPVDLRDRVLVALRSTTVVSDVVSDGTTTTTSVTTTSVEITQER